MLVLQALCSFFHAMLKLAVQLEQGILVLFDLRRHSKKMMGKLMQLRWRATRYDLLVRLRERSASQSLGITD
ncbi:hypothetical protein D3C84_1009920 [compost metagenome]